MITDVDIISWVILYSENPAFWIARQTRIKVNIICLYKQNLFIHRDRLKASFISNGVGFSSDTSPAFEPLSLSFHVVFHHLDILIGFFEIISTPTYNLEHIIDPSSSYFYLSAKSTSKIIELVNKWCQCDTEYR